MARADASCLIPRLFRLDNPCSHSEASASLPSMRVLIADDDRLSATLLARTLTQQRFEVVTVHDGVLFIPPNAVIGRGRDRGAYVAKGGVAYKRTIDVGISTWEAVEVQGGLSEGDEVVATLTAADLKDGARIEARPLTAGGAR